MKITIAICTYNRATLLRETLECIKEIKKPETCDYIIVVVNNCCTDHTDSVVETYKSTLPICLIHESKPGLSNARNAAIKEAERATSDYILWTDDDVRPHEDWLIEYVHTFKKRPDIAIAGGTIEPWFESPPPKWILDNWEHLQWAYAVRDLGLNEFYLTQETALPFGANFCIRTKEQVIHPYDPRLGVIKGKRLAGEETVVMRAILNSGEKGIWLPNAKVKHFIERKRLNFIYISKYFFGMGQTAGLAEKIENTHTIFNRPAWLYKKSLLSVYHLAIAAITHNGTAVKKYTEMLFFIGKLSINLHSKHL